MVREVILPKLGQTMEEGAIVEWMKQEGDPISRGEVMFTTESDKATLEVEAPGRGFLRRILVPEGETVPVLTVVGLMTSTLEEDMSAYQPQGPSFASDVGLAEAAAPEAPEAKAPERAVAEPERGRVFSSPRARRLAREKGFDLAQIAGSGPDGRIVERDVVAYLEAEPRATPTAQRMASRVGVELASLTGTGPAGRVLRADVEAALEAKAPVPERPASEAAGPAEGEVVPLAGVRRLIARRMAESARTTARLTLTTEADATELVELVRSYRELLEGQEVIPGYNDLLLKAVGRALQDHPYLNARWLEEGGRPAGIELRREINIGVAVDTERGLVVPVIDDVPSKGLGDIARQRRTLTERALSGRLLPDDLAGGTFTLTNMGMFGVDAFTPLINLPECAILGIGRIRAKPVVYQGAICARQMMTLSLTFDHRIVDGAPAARFLQRVNRLIEQPALLLL